MASFIAALMGAIPVTFIAVMLIPMLIIEMGIYAFPEIFNSEVFAGLLNISEMQPDALMEYFQSLFYVVEMQ